MTLKDLNQEKDEESPIKHTDEMELNEKHLSLIYDSLSDVVFLLAVEPDDCFRFVSVNQAFLSVTGLTREQVVGKRIEQVLPETAHALVISKYKEAISKNKTVFWEEVSAYPTGELVGAVTVTPVRTAEGVCTHLVGSVHDLTEIRRAEKIMQESEEKYKALYDNAPLSYQSLNEDGNFNDVNPAWLRTLGYDRKEVIGEWFGDFLHPDWKPHFEKNFQEFKRRGYVHNVQFKIKHKDGHYLDISFEGYIGYNPDGSFKQTYCVFQNITERKQAENELRESEARFKSIFSEAPIAIEYYDSEGSLIDVNQECLNIFGVDDIKELEGFKLFEDPNLSEEAKRQVKEGKPYKYETEFDFELVKEHKLYKTLKSGQCFLNILITPYEISELNEGGYLVHVEDITKRKQAEEALKDSESSLASAQRIAHLGCWTFELATSVVKWSDELYRIFGLDPESEPPVWPDGHEHLYHPDDWARSKDTIEKSIAKGESYSVENRIIRETDGAVLHTIALGNPKYSNDGSIKEYVGTVQDITETKQAEEALHESEENLRAILDASPDVIHLLDINGIILSSNKGFAKRMGLEIDDVIGKCVFDYTPTESVHNRKAAIDKVFRTGEPLQFEDRGLTGIFESHIHPVFNPAGEVTAVAVYARDITERKQAEEALRQSEQDLRLRNQINNIFLTYPDEEIYAEILELIRKAMESKYGTFGYFDENGSFMAPAVTKKIYWDKCNVPEKNIIFEKGTFGGIWGRAIKERKTLISNDGPFNTPKGHIPIENTIVTPIIFHDEVISAIHIANKPNGYDEKDRVVLETIADQIAPVLYARLQRDRRNMQRKQAEKALWERIKELKCLYNIAEISNRPEIALDELFQESVSLLPLGWQYPEITGCRITVDGKVYSTKNFKETKWMQREDIHTTNEIFGTVEVCYLKEKPDENEGPFLEEERKLIENIARQLGEHITRKQAEEELQKRMNELETFYRTTLGREERVIELKQEVNELLEQLGKNKKYRDYS